MKKAIVIVLVLAAIVAGAVLCPCANGSWNLRAM